MLIYYHICNKWKNELKIKTLNQQNELCEQKKKEEEKRKVHMKEREKKTLITETKAGREQTELARKEKEREESINTI